jgi:cobyrinic acid a,c-diamide synthase
LSGVIIAAPASGSGKTLVTLGLLRHLANAGEDVVSAKVGPDYIDPAFHAAASGQACRNLDAWAMQPETLNNQLAELTISDNLIVCEGVMGLFDGARVASGTLSGSTADIARISGWPVVLIVDARAQAASAAAVVRGFTTHQPGITIAGVIFNRVGGAAHAAILRQACTDTLPDIPVLGCLPRGAGMQLPSRHLGLVQALEHPDLEAFIEGAAAMIGDHIDIAALRRLMHAGEARQPISNRPALPPLGQRIAVARDAAFAFSYAHVLDGWQAAGSEVDFFSPLADEAPKSGSDAVYLPGGYPELHAGKLAGNSTFLQGLRDTAESGAAVFGECGGYMVLGRALTDGNGEPHTMAGLLAVETSFASPKLTLGYRQAKLVAGGPLGEAGTAFQGHEFHYAKVVNETGADPLFQITDAAGNELGHAGQHVGRVVGSFIHLIDRADHPS